MGNSATKQSQAAANQNVFLEQEIALLSSTYGYCAGMLANLPPLRLRPFDGDDSLTSRTVCRPQVAFINHYRS